MFGKNKTFIYKNHSPILRMNKNLKISEEAHNALCEMGKKNESFDSIIKRLVEEIKQNRRK